MYNFVQYFTRKDDIPSCPTVGLSNKPMSEISGKFFNSLDINLLLVIQKQRKDFLKKQQNNLQISEDL